MQEEISKLRCSKSSQEQNLVIENKRLRERFANFKSLHQLSQQIENTKEYLGDIYRQIEMNRKILNERERGSQREELLQNLENLKAQLAREQLSNKDLYKKQIKTLE